MEFKLLSVSIILAALCQHALGEPLPNAENVCNISIPIKKDITFEIPVNYELKVHQMCGLMPCQKTRIETRMDQKIRTIIQHVVKATCCPGYAETPDRQCAPICLSACNNGGKCVATNVCQCHPTPTESSPGFVGPTCSRFVCLSANKWGSKCERECNCPANAYCSANSGKCHCYSGWRGANCTLECNPNDKSDPECEEALRLPPILEPDVNVMEAPNMIRSAKMISSPDALTLDQGDASEPLPIGLTSTLQTFCYVSSLIWILMIAYMLFKRRNRRANQEEHYYSSGSSARRGDYSDGSESYYSTNRGGQASKLESGFLGKNLTFETATRNVSLGLSTPDAKNNRAALDAIQKRQLPAVSPRLETHLISSQLSSKQNLYSEPQVADKQQLDDDDNRSAQNVSKSIPGAIALDLSQATLVNDEDHIYQVPKSPAFIGQSQDADRFVFVRNDEPHDMDDGQSNIYEEIKPRAPNGQ